MFMYSLEDAVITPGAARMWVQCLGFQGPRRQPDLSLDLISHMKPLKDRNRFETNHWKKNLLWKLFLAIILIHFFLWPHDTNYQNLELALNSAQTEKKRCYHHCDKLYLCCVILCSIRGCRAEHQVVCGSLGCFPAQPQTVVAQLRHTQGARGRQRH